MNSVHLRTLTQLVDSINLLALLQLTIPVLALLQLPIPVTASKKLPMFALIDADRSRDHPEIPSG